MRISEIKIQNFRCFKGLHNFNITGSTIILYGENGYGKSSFFDAIEWCLTGSIDRFRQPGKPINKSIILNRSTESEGICSVEIKMVDIILKRSFKNIDLPREMVVVKNLSDEPVVSGKENVERYFEENIAKKTANKKVLSSLLKKSHILSQDQITDFVIRDNPKERFDSLADIMGYRQLVNLNTNFKRIRDELSRAIKKEQQNISTYQDIINNRLKEKVEIDIYEVNSILNDLLIDVRNNSMILNDIKKKEELLLGNKARLSERLVNLNNLSHNITNSTSRNLEERANVLKKIIDENFNRRRKVERLLDKTEEADRKVIKSLSNLDTQNDLYKERSQLEKKEKELEYHLTNYSETKITMLLGKVEKKQKELFYANTHMLSYGKSHHKVIETPEIILQKKITIDKLKRKLKNAERYLRKFELLLDCEEEGSSLSKLNSAIEDIYSYVSNNTLGVCPVCSTEKGDGLSNIILKNIDTNLTHLRQSSNKVIKVNSKIKKLRRRIENLTLDREKEIDQIESLEIGLKIAKDDIYEIERNELFNKSLIIEEPNDIKAHLKSAAKEINDLNNLKVKFYSLKSIKNKLQEMPRVKDQNVTESINRLKNKRTNLQVRKEKFEILIEKTIKELKSSQKEYEKINQNIFLVSEIIPESKMDIPIDNIIGDFIKEVKEIEVRLEKIKIAQEYYKKLKENEKVEGNIKDYKNIIEIKKGKIRQYKVAFDDIQNYREYISNQIGDKASDLLNQPDSKIQKYFRYLNPVPGVNKVLFKSPSAEELEIVLSYEDKTNFLTNESSVQHSLSSGQLYVLAISIFLAINESQNLSKLDFVGIDDPIQNMDDVNQFSICDVLSSINKQLIFSTHDFEFLRLFLKKNEFKKDSIQVFMLENDNSIVTTAREMKF
jgi:DNA repair protein SbcC/Rad50